MVDINNTFSVNNTIDVLVVDDLDANLFAMKQMLLPLNVNILLASSATQGLRILLNQKVDIILLDYSMPEMNGLEMAEIIHSQFNEPPPIIFVTAHGTYIKELEQACYEMGAIDFMEKPVREHILIAKLKVLMALTEQKERLRQLATTDSLTGLKNRMAFADVLKFNLAVSLRQKTSMAVLAFDLDGFKLVNDQYGHAAGDELLIAFSNYLKKCTRESDVAARLGGDEFNVLLTNIHSVNEAVSVADKILQACLQPVIFEGISLQLQTSIGIAMCPEHTSSAMDILKFADAALYNAKNEGKGIIRVYSQRPEDAIALNKLNNVIDCKLLPVVNLGNESNIAGYQAIPILKSEAVFNNYFEVLEFTGRLGKQQQLNELVLNCAIASAKLLNTDKNKKPKLFFNFESYDSSVIFNLHQLEKNIQKLDQLNVQLVVLLNNWQSMLCNTNFISDLKQLAKNGLEVCLLDVGSTSIPTNLIKLDLCQYIVFSNDFIEDAKSDPIFEILISGVAKLAKQHNCKSIVANKLTTAESIKFANLECDYKVLS